MWSAPPPRCCTGKDEDDFRPLFDNFVQDLLSTLSLPEWPASEVLLTLMGVLLVRREWEGVWIVFIALPSFLSLPPPSISQVQTFSNRSNEQQLRLISLEHLGVIAARLRKDAITSVKENHEQLVDILAEVGVVYSSGRGRF